MAKPPKINKPKASMGGGGRNSGEISGLTNFTNAQDIKNRF